MNNDSFIYVFLFLISLMDFSSLTILLRNLNTVLNMTDDSIDFSFILDLKGVNIK